MRRVHYHREQANFAKMSIRMVSILSAVMLITIAPGTALTIPKAVLRLVNSPATPVPVSEEPERPQWPTQYQVRLLQASPCGTVVMHIFVNKAVTNSRYRTQYGVALPLSTTFRSHRVL